MGDEISRRYFDAEHFSAFRQKLDEETELLRGVFDRDEFSHRGDTAGFELEAWLIDARGDPLADNERFLEHLNNSLVVPELATFNIELNGSPSTLSGRVFSRLYDELSATWSACLDTAESLGCRLLTIGILPTAKDHQFSAEYMSHMVRYHSLNDRVMAVRDGRPIEIDIEGDTDVHIRHQDVMLEAAATSFQVHLQCRPERAVDDFNASIVASAPIVAAAANSPLLFGHTVWDETRIPLFEQSVDIGNRYPRRVSFGSGYVKHSLFEIFEENQKDHLILIPEVQDTPPNKFSHLRFHNGTLWRWNRPLIGFDFDGQVHVRIEHRVIPAGPTLKDSIANSAFYFGLVRGMGNLAVPIQERLPFEQARDNFYNAARYGLNARVCWPGEHGEEELSVRTLINDRLLPLARSGLQSLDIPDAEVDEYLGIIAARVESSQNGAAWQKRWMALNDPDCYQLVERYRELQDAGNPVHTWPL